MAEVLGVAASGVGVASFALQLVNSATRLRCLWADVKDAPKEVLDLVREIEVLGRLLGTIKTIHRPIPDAAIFKAIIDQCYSLCEESAQNLQKVAHELEMLIKQKRTLGSLRIVLKKDIVAKLTSQLERSKSSLLLAQQTYLSMQSAYHT